ncbi:hypothetical protein AKJ16_DCAP05135 [Drosera capensis]
MHSEPAGYPQTRTGASSPNLIPSIHTTHHFLSLTYKAFLFSPPNLSFSLLPASTPHCNTSQHSLAAPPPSFPPPPNHSPFRVPAATRHSNIGIYL